MRPEQGLTRETKRDARGAGRLRRGLLDLIPVTKSVGDAMGEVLW